MEPAEGWKVDHKLQAYVCIQCGLLITEEAGKYCYFDVMAAHKMEHLNNANIPTAKSRNDREGKDFSESYGLFFSSHKTSRSLECSGKASFK